MSCMEALRHADVGHSLRNLPRCDTLTAELMPERLAGTGFVVNGKLLMTPSPAKRPPERRQRDDASELAGDRFGDRLRAARRRQDLTLREVSERTGTSITYLSDLERGVLANPTLDKLVLIARGLGVSINELLGEPVPNGENTERTPASLMEFSKMPQFREAVATEAKRWRTSPDALCREWLKTLERVSVDGRRPKEPLDYMFIFEAIRRAVE